MALSDVRNDTITDREILYILTDVSDDEGYATTEEVAEQIGLNTSKAKNPNSNVGVRLGYMRRIGLLVRERVVETDPEVGRKHFWAWKLTQAGEDFRNGRLSNPQRAVVESLKEAQLPDLSAAFAQAYSRSSVVGRHVSRRELFHGLHKAVRNGR